MDLIRRLDGRGSNKPSIPPQYHLRIPVHEGTLGVHQIELVVETSPRLGDGGRVAQHAHGTLHLGEISAGQVVDAHLEADRTPIDELFASFDR